MTFYFWDSDFKSSDGLHSGEGKWSKAIAPNLLTKFVKKAGLEKWIVRQEHMHHTDLTLMLIKGKMPELDDELTCGNKDSRTWGQTDTDKSEPRPEATAGEHSPEIKQAALSVSVLKKIAIKSGKTSKDISDKYYGVPRLVDLDDATTSKVNDQEETCYQRAHDELEWRRS